MLAHNGLALITEKLQNQRLEELPTSVAGSVSNSYGVPSRLPVGYDNVSKHANPPQSNLAVKGKNVWALTVESERGLNPSKQQQGGHVQECVASGISHVVPVPRPPTLRPLISLQSSDKWSVPNPPSHGSMTGPNCQHKKLRHSTSCHFCNSAPGTPSAPPKKKHCRSLSVPPDSNGGFTSSMITPTSNRDTSGNLLWKPIAVIPLTGNNSCGSNSVGDLTDRFASINNNNVSAAFTKHWLPNLSGSTSLKLVPPSASAASSDSGHFTTSSDFQTPPGSPAPPMETVTAMADSNSAVLRPASASSFNTLGSNWLESKGAIGATSFCSNTNQQAFRAGVRALQNRSLSCEDRISGSSPFSSSSPHTVPSCYEVGSSGSTTASMPCVHVAGVMETSQYFPNLTPVLTASVRCRSCSHDGGDLLGVPDGVGDSYNIPRCHSQPCVLHHRRCGKKRRRNWDRPTLNFNKMTETAYMRGSHRRSEPWSMPIYKQQCNILGQQHYNPSIEIPRNGNGNCSVTSLSRLGFGLNPIASSPLDSDLPLDLFASMSSSSQDNAASMALPMTPPDQLSTSPMFSTFTPAVPPPPRLRGRNFRHKPGGGSYNEEDSDVGEEDDYEEEEEEDSRNCGCRESRTEERVGLVFPISDLDLEQIENH